MEAVVAVMRMVVASFSIKISHHFGQESRVWERRTYLKHVELVEFIYLKHASYPLI